jgi:hypothetical protein
MARTITSDVGGRTLTAPVSHDLFEIVAAAMPNGDSCLGLTSDTTGAWYAYDRTDALVPTNTGASIKWTINMWIQRGEGLGTTTTHFLRNGLFNSTLTTAAAQHMAMAHISSAGTVITGMAGRISTGTAWNTPSSGWSMLTLAYDGSVGTNGTIYQWFNGSTIVGTGIAQSTAYATPFVDPEWSLGWNNVALTSNRGFARDAAPTTRTLIGKLAVWRTRKLSNTEVAELYAAM